jgi:GNS1/SUR4 family
MRICFFNRVINSITDLRTKDWFLVDNFGLLVVISTAYVGVVLFGPRLMQNVKPFSLKRVIQVYNLIMIVVNAYIFQQVCVQNYCCYYFNRNFQ